MYIYIYMCTTVWVAIVGSGGTKGPLLEGPFGGLRAGASQEAIPPQDSWSGSCAQCMGAFL